MKTEAELEQAMISLIRAVMPRQLRKTPVMREMRLQRDLGLDSLGIAALLFRLEEEFGLDLFGDPELPAKMGNLQTVGDLISLTASLRRGSEPHQV